MKRIAILAALFAAACGGGGGGSKTNPATTATFNYAAGTPASTADRDAGVSATANAVTSVTAFNASPGTSSASNVAGALFTAADAALGGSFSLADAPVSRALPLFRQVRAEALTLGEMPGSSLPSNCGAISNSGNTVTFDPTVCKVFDDKTTPGTTVTATLSGQVTRVAPGNVNWDLAISVTIADPQMNITVHYDDTGDVAVAASTLKAHQEASIQATASASGKSLSIGMAQSADLDVTYASTCTTGVTGGTFEAKRVWTTVPSDLRNANPDQYRNKGVLITWNGCNTPTTPATAVIVVK
jgi:hypothetical protein